VEAAISCEVLTTYLVCYKARIGKLYRFWRAAV